MSKQKPEAPRHARVLGIRGQLFLFMSVLIVLTLGALWLLTTNFLQPRYNRYIRTKLEAQLTTLVSMIDASDEPISSRDFFTLTINEDFWNLVNEACTDGTLDLTNLCVDVSDTTLRSIIYVENLHPCLLHASENRFGDGASSSRDSGEAIRLRRQLYENDDLYRILETSSGTRQMVVGKLSADGQYAIIMSTSLAQIDAAGDVFGSLLPPVALGLLLVGFLASFFFSKWFTRPLTEMSAAAREMANGNYNVRVPVSGNDEIAALAADFNHMAGEVQRTSQLQRDLLANVSHDLRTPLTLIKGYAETVRDITGENPETRTDQLNIIVDETDRLSGLVGSVMELSKVSSGTDRPNPVRFDMSQLCFEVAGRYDAVCAQNNWTLQLDADKACMVTADPAMMERVLHNLLGNATHHIGADGIIILRAMPHPEGGCRVEVQDHGEGIKAEDLPYLFDRYYRSRSDAGKVGTGLGLSITKAILQSHGYRFGVNSTEGKGTTFWFEMTDQPNLPAR